MLSAVIIDDEIHSVKSLQWLLTEYCPDVQVSYTTSNPRTALAQLHNAPPDILFLDIEMPGMSGIEIALKLKDMPVHIIFTTAYDQYAIQAIRLNALDYLLKPVQKEELQQAVAKAIGRRPTQLTERVVQFAGMLEGKLPGKIALPTRQGFRMVEIDKIIRIEAEGSYSNIVVDTKEVMLISRNIGDMEEVLPPAIFFRPHKSYLINLHYVEQYKRTDGGEIVLKDGHSIPLSRNKKEEFEAAFLRL